RPAECLGLTWPLVDLRRDLIDISWQLQPLPYDHGCGGECGYKKAASCPARRFRVPREYEMQHLTGAMVLARPKPARGPRVAPVPWMHTALERWRDTAPESPHGLVWPNADGSPRDEKEDRASWYALQAAAGISKTSGASTQEPHAQPVRWALYEARHTTATL